MPFESSFVGLTQHRTFFLQIPKCLGSRLISDTSLFWCRGIAFGSCAELQSNEHCRLTCIDGWDASSLEIETVCQDGISSFPVGWAVVCCATINCAVSMQAVLFWIRPAAVDFCMRFLCLPVTLFVLGLPSVWLLAVFTKVVFIFFRSDAMLILSCWCEPQFGVFSIRGTFIIFWCRDRCCQRIIWALFLVVKVFVSGRRQCVCESCDSPFELKHCRSKHTFGGHVPEMIAVWFRLSCSTDCSF